MSIRLGREVADLRWLGELARRLVADASLADDACQEAWLAASRGGTVAPDRGRLVLALRRFLWRTRRSDGRRRRREAEAAAREALPSTAELLEAGEQRQRVWEHLVRVDEPYRSTLLLRFQEDLPTSAIAERLGLGADTVRWRIRRGLELLRDSLERDRAGGGLAALVPAIPSSIRPDLAPPAAPTTGVGAATLGAGVLVMSKLVAAVLLGAVTLFVLFDRGSSDEPDTPSFIASPGAPPAVATAPVDVAPRPVATAATGAPADRREALPTAAAEPLAAAVLVGRVVDPTGSPRAAVSIELAGRDWESTVATELDGTFRLEVPAVGAPRAILSLEGPPTVERGWFDFSAESFADWGEVDARPGAVTDLGDIALADAGVVSGRVVDADGAGIAGAMVRLSGSRQTPTDANGYFTSNHVDGGEQRMTVFAPGFLDRVDTIAVAVLEERRVGEIRLDAAPRARGRVVDEAGRPLPDAAVSSRGWGHGWRFEVGPDGSFDVPLPKLENAELTAVAPGYEEPYFGIPVRPGAEGVEIVLRALGVPCRVQLVDDGTGEPLDFVAIELDRRMSRFRAAPTPRLVYRASREIETRDGWLEFHGQPGEDVVDVAARGYASLAVVLDESATGAGQVLRLVPAPGVRGRVLVDGEPRAGVEVVLTQAELARLRPDREGIDAVEDFELTPLSREARNQGGYSVSPVRCVDGDPPAPAVRLGGMRRTDGLPGRRATTGADGRFHFDQVSPQALQVHARTADGRLAHLSEIQMPAPGETDLGDLELEPTGRIEGRLVGAPARHLAGHRVTIVESGPFEAITDEGGVFTLEGLPAGDHVLSVAADASLVLRSWDRVYFVPVEPGATRTVSVEVDAAPSATVAVRVRHNGEPVAGEFFELDSADDEGRGRTLDDDGRTELRVTADVPLQAALNIERQRIDLGAPRRFAEGAGFLELELWSGALELALPAVPDLPPDARVLLQWRTEESVSSPRPLVGALRGTDQLEATFSVVPEGARELTVELRTGKAERGSAGLLASWPLSVAIARGVTEQVDLTQSK